MGCLYAGGGPTGYDCTSMSQCSSCPHRRGSQKRIKQTKQSAKARKGSSGSVFVAIIGLCFVGLTVASLAEQNKPPDSRASIAEKASAGAVSSSASSQQAALSAFRRGGGVYYSEIPSNGPFRYKGKIGVVYYNGFTLEVENAAWEDGYNVVLKYIQRNEARPYSEESFNQIVNLATWHQDSTITCFSDQPAERDKSGRLIIRGDCDIGLGGTFSQALLASRDHWRLR